MNAFSILKLFFLIGILSFCISCNKDNTPEYKDLSKGIPLTLSYKYYEIEEFKMYVGSPTGGKEIYTKETSPESYWQNYFDEKDSLFQNLQLYFLLNQKVVNLLTSDTFSYCFTKEGLKWTPINTNEWKHSGLYGDLKRLYSKQSFYSFAIYDGKDSVVRESNTLEGYQNLESVLQMAGLQFLRQMTNSRDTIMWCNVDYVLK